MLDCPCTEAGVGGTPNLIWMLRLMTLHAPGEFERKFSAHTRESGQELSWSEQVQVGVGKAEWVGWALTVATGSGWRKVTCGRFKFPAGAKGGGEVIGLLISLSRCGAKGKGG